MRLIDADEVVSVFDYYITHGQVMARQFNSLFYHGMQDAYARARSVVLETPTVDPVKHGRWVDKYGDGDWHCTRCGAIVEKHEQGWRNWYFCYHCGALMDEVSE